MAETSTNPKYRSLTTFSYFPITGLGILAFGEVIKLFFGLAQVISPQTMIDIEDAISGKPTATSVWIMFQALLIVLEFPVYIFTIIFFLIWLYRAYNNLYPLKAVKTNYSPAWAVGYWFIPFVNLFRPYQVVREIWGESDPNVDPDFGILRNQPEPQTVLSAWWAFWVLSNISQNITARLFDRKEPEIQETIGYAFMLSGGLTLAAAIFAIMVVRSISERQEIRFQKLNQNGQLSPPMPPTFE